jgi:hypothetical protein
MRLKGVFFASLLLALLTACHPTTGPDNPTMLHVTRTETLPGYNFAPLDVTIRDATTVQHIYQAAYALPPPPSGIYNCLADIGLVYHLEFFQNGASVDQMRLNPTGCQTLWIGDDDDDVRQSNEAFHELLSKAIGIPSLVPPIPGRGRP